MAARLDLERPVPNITSDPITFAAKVSSPPIPWKNTCSLLQNVDG
jgi:hypothetical protein